IEMIVGPAKVDGKILAFDEPGLLQTLPQRCDKWRGASSRRATEKADHRHPSLLRARRERPRNCSAAEQRNKRAPPHSITSSARASSDQHRWSVEADPKSLRRSRYSPPRSSRVTWRQGPQGSKQHFGSCSSRHAHPNSRPRKSSFAYRALASAKTPITIRLVPTSST